MEQLWFGMGLQQKMVMLESRWQRFKQQVWISLGRAGQLDWLQRYLLKLLHLKELEQLNLVDFEQLV